MHEHHARTHTRTHAHIKREHEYVCMYIHTQICTYNICACDKMAACAHRKRPVDRGVRNFDNRINEVLLYLEILLVSLVLFGLFLQSIQSGGEVAE